jgi:cytoskeletal protein RodZ
MSGEKNNNPTKPLTATNAEELDLSKKEFGAMMRRCREDAGFTVAQLANETKILAAFIEALEQGEFGILPGAVFGRGFIKSICKILGAQPAAYLEAYEKACGDKSEVKQDKTSLKVPVTDSIANFRFAGESFNEFKSFTEKIKSFSIRSTLRGLNAPKAFTAAGIVAALGLIVAINIYSPRKKSAVSTADLTKTVNEQNVFVAEPVEEVAVETAPSEIELKEEAKVAAVAEPAAVPDVPVAEKVAEINVDQQSEGAAPIGEEQVLDIVVKNPVKIRMKMDGDAWVTNSYEPNSYQLRFKQSAQLLVLNAASVSIVFNGKPLGELGQEGRVRRLSFFAKNDAAPESKKL